MQDNPPLDYEDDVLYPESCTKGVSKESQSLVRYFDPVWINQLKLKLGWQNKLEIFSIVLLFQKEGACVFHSDPELQKRRIDELNQLDESKFDHASFKAASNTR